MRLLSLASALLFAVFATGCEYQYTATVECKTGQSCGFSSGAGCTKDDALIAAKNACNGTPGRTTKESSYLVLVGTCDPNRTAEELQPIAETGTILRERYQLLTQGSQAAAEVPDCGGGIVGFKVTVHNEYRPYNTCPDAKEMRIAYSRYISDTESTPVVRSIMVPFGGSHEFTVSDCAVRPQDNGKGRVAVYSQLYDASGFPDCTVIPVDEGATGASYMLANGQQLTINEHPETGGFIPTISDQDASSAPSAEKTTKAPLKPIPDPKFTRNR
jgi:hypothetical protein